MTWINIKETEAKYSVSSTGLIRNNSTMNILNGSWTGRTKKRERTPYKVHGLMVGGSRVFNLTHRIVALHFIPNPNNYPQVNHINEDVQDNRVENLEWTTNKKNARHSNKREILQKDINGNLIKKWGSLHEIGDAGFQRSNVCMVVNNYRGRKTHKGYKWEYV